MNNSSHSFKDRVYAVRRRYWLMRFKANCLNLESRILRAVGTFAIALKLGWLCAATTEQFKFISADRDKLDKTIESIETELDALLVEAGF